MAYTPHELVQPQAIVDTMVEGLGDELVVANTFTRFAADQFLGAAGDKITKRVPGTLPFRNYGFRNDRKEPLRVDTYSETLVDMTVAADDIYSAVELTPEQMTFDFDGDFGRLFNAQTDAIVRGIEFEAMRQITGAEYELVRPISINLDEEKEQAEYNRSHLFNQFVDLRADLHRMRNRESSYVVIAGVDWISEFQKDNKLVRVAGQGDNAFANATIGDYAGFTIVQGPYTMKSDEAFVYSSSAFLFWNAAVTAPLGTIAAATANKNNVSMLWVQDYDPAYVVNRSIFHSWKSFSVTKDHLSLEAPTGQLITSPEEFFIRAVKLVLTDERKHEANSKKVRPAFAAKGHQPGDGNTNAPGGNPESFLGKAFNNELADGYVPEGLFMPLHLRPGAATQNGTPTVVAAGTDETPEVVPGA